MRYHPRKVDANQKEIVAALRRAGCTVELLHTVGRGCPDLLVGSHGQNWLMETKTVKAQTVFGDGVKGTHAATAARQKAWTQAWRGAPPLMVRTADEALSALGLLRERPKETGAERFL